MPAELEWFDNSPQVVEIRPRVSARLATPTEEKGAPGSTCCPLLRADMRRTAFRSA